MVYVWVSANSGTFLDILRLQTSLLGLDFLLLPLFSSVFWFFCHAFHPSCVLICVCVKVEKPPKIQYKWYINRYFAALKIYLIPFKQEISEKKLRRLKRCSIVVQSFHYVFSIHKKYSVVQPVGGAGVLHQLSLSQVAKQRQTESWQNHNI